MASLRERLDNRTRMTPTCWLWTGATTKGGYGLMGYGSRTLLYVHRLSYELSNGRIPDGFFVLHRCDVPNCVRPDHLFIGHHSDNMRDMAMKCRSGTARLTREEVETIRTKYARREATQQDLANEFGVAQTTISAAIRLNWKHAKYPQA